MRYGPSVHWESVGALVLRYTGRAFAFRNVSCMSSAEVHPDRVRWLCIRCRTPTCNTACGDGWAVSEEMDGRFLRRWTGGFLGDEWTVSYPPAPGGCAPKKNPCVDASIHLWGCFLIFCWRREMLTEAAASLRAVWATFDQGRMIMGAFLLGASAVIALQKPSNPLPPLNQRQALSIVNPAA